MPIQKLERQNGVPFFDYLSRMLAGSQVEIDAGPLALGGRVLADWVPLIGVVYDPKDDLVEVALEGLHYLIHKPREDQSSSKAVASWRASKSSTRRAPARSSSSSSLCCPAPPK